MKKLFITAAFAVLAASPALAATHHTRAVTTANASYANDSYAYAAPGQDYVVVNGQVVGADPDAFIRESLRAQQNPADFAGN